MCKLLCCTELLLDGSLLRESPELSPKFKAFVLDRMHKDRVRSVASGDPLVVNFGTVLLKRLGPCLLYTSDAADE